MSKLIRHVFLFLVCLALIVPTSCNSTPSVKKSIVQVWSQNVSGNDALLSFGVVVGDGSQVLTVFNFENDLPETVLVVQPGKENLTGYVQSIDPRNSAMLIRLNNVKLPPAKIAEVIDLKRGDEVSIYGWSGPDFNTLQRANTFFPGENVVFMTDVEDTGFIAYDGAVVTNNNGEVVGLLGTFYDAFVIRLGGPGSAPAMVDIRDAIELLSPSATNQPLAKGPVYTLVQASEDAQGHRLFHEPPKNKYKEMTFALESLFNTLGEPLSSGQLPDNYRNYLYEQGENRPDGTLLGIIYPYPVELKNAQGELLAKAKWVGIQWDRSEGKSNQLFYGIIDQFGNAITEGGFILNGDITELEKAIN